MEQFEGGSLYSMLERAKERGELGLVATCFERYAPFSSVAASSEESRVIHNWRASLANVPIEEIQRDSRQVRRAMERMKTKWETL